MKKNNKKPILFLVLASILIIGIFQIGVYYEQKPIKDAERNTKESNEAIANKFKEMAEKVKEIEEKDEAAQERKRKIAKLKATFKENVSYQQLIENSSKYQGEPIKFKGKIIKIIDREKDSKLNKMYLSLESNRENIVIVEYTKAVLYNTFSIKEGDNVAAYGYMQELSENKTPATTAILIEQYSI